MNRAIILAAGLMMALPVAADDSEPYPDELMDILQEQAELNHRLKGSTARGVTEGYGGRPLGTTVAEERRLQQMDEIQARADGQRMFALEARKRAIVEQQRQAMEAQQRAHAEATRRESARVYEQVLQSMQSYGANPQPQQYEPPPSGIFVPSAEDVFQQKRTEANRWPQRERSAPPAWPAPSSPPTYPLPDFTELPRDPGYSHEPNYGEQIRDIAERLTSEN